MSHWWLLLVFHHINGCGAKQLTPAFSQLCCLSLLLLLLFASSQPQTWKWIWWHIAWHFVWRKLLSLAKFAENSRWLDYSCYFCAEIIEIGWLETWTSKFDTINIFHLRDCICFFFKFFSVSNYSCPQKYSSAISHIIVLCQVWSGSMKYAVRGEKQRRSHSPWHLCFPQPVSLSVPAHIVDTAVKLSSAHGRQTCLFPISVLHVVATRRERGRLGLALALICLDYLFTRA